jgi:cytochrome c oxidase subunit 2
MRWVWIVLVVVILVWWWLPPLQAQVGDKSFQEGKKLYEGTCADCHRVNGHGLPAMFPALDGDSFVTGDANQVVDTVLYGRKGKLGQMPAWKDTFNDQQLADIITYIRQAWSNKGGAVTADNVKKRRK